MQEYSTSSRLEENKERPWSFQTGITHASLLLLSNPLGAACSPSSAAALDRSFLGRPDPSLSVSSSLIYAVRGILLGLCCSFERLSLLLAAAFLATGSAARGAGVFLFWGFKFCFACSGSSALPSSLSLAVSAALAACCLLLTALLGAAVQTEVAVQVAAFCQQHALRKLLCGTRAGGRLRSCDAGGALHLQTLSTGAGNYLLLPAQTSSAPQGRRLWSCHPL